MVTEPALKREVIVSEDLILDRNWGRSAQPQYKVSTVAQVFFAMSPSWIRLHLGKGTFTDENGDRMKFRRLVYEDVEGTDGELVRIIRVAPEEETPGVTARVFLLSDIGDMAYSLFEKGHIDGARLVAVLGVVAAQGRLFGLIDDKPAEAAPAEAPKESCDV